IRFFLPLIPSAPPFRFFPSAHPFRTPFPSPPSIYSPSHSSSYPLSLLSSNPKFPPISRHSTLALRMRGHTWEEIPEYLQRGLGKQYELDLCMPPRLFTIKRLVGLPS